MWCHVQLEQKILNGIQHRSTIWRQKKRLRTTTADDNLIRKTFGDIAGGGRAVQKLLKLIHDKPGLADKLLKVAELEDDSGDDEIPPIRSLALMHQAGLTLEQWNMVNEPYFCNTYYIVLI